LKYISILGSTGSIGRSTLDVVSQHPELFRVAALAAGSNIKLLEDQIHAFRPEVVAVYNDASAEELKKKKLPAEILAGEQGLAAVASFDKSDMVVSAIVGSPGLLPTYEAIKAGKDIALANKEALVMAGKLIMEEASSRGVSIIPVDSEHSAVFQCLHGRDMKEVKKVILTASGGSLRTRSTAELESISPAEALKHPNWDMGRKITIDSATLMNKGLEVIEARWLFDVPADRIGVILHPQSIVHSMVEFVDSSVIAQMSLPDMKGPISYALSYPDRLGDVLPALDLAAIQELTFEEPDHGKYPCLSLAFEALRAGGTMPCVLNAANEVAVDAFLNERIAFTGIHRVVSRIMESHSVEDYSTVEQVMEASDRARKETEEMIMEKIKI
jgi:1-deoxy-D-xylulose-5-phosphate reductoisomerase